MVVFSLGACQQAAKEETKVGATGAPENKPGIGVAEGKFLLPIVAGNPGAAYFLVNNEGTGSVSIASIAIEGVGKTEIHQTMGGTMKPVDRIDVEPKITLKFEQGGLHVMAFEVNNSLKVGETTEMTITFADGDKVSAPLKIEAMGAGTDHGDGH